MDPDPAIFGINLQDASKKTNFNTIFSAYYFLKLHLHNFSKIKSQKGSQNSRNQGFSYYYCMMIEKSGSGSIPLTSGSGSGRPKNMWIRIHNTALKSLFLCERLTINQFKKVRKVPVPVQTIYQKIIACDLRNNFTSVCGFDSEIDRFLNAY